MYIYSFTDCSFHYRIWVKQREKEVLVPLVQEILPRHHLLHLYHYSLLKHLIKHLFQEVFFEDFKVDTKFIIKEIAVACLDSYETTNFLIKSPYEFERLSLNKQVGLVRTSHFCHGIRWEDGNTSIDDAIRMLKILTSSAKLIYAKGEMKSKIFEKLLEKPITNLKLVFQ